MEQQPPNPDNTSPETEPEKKHGRKKLERLLRTRPLFRFGEQLNPEVVSDDAKAPEVKKGGMNERLRTVLRRVLFGEVIEANFVRSEKKPSSDETEKPEAEPFEHVQPEASPPEAATEHPETAEITPPEPSEAGAEPKEAPESKPVGPPTPPETPPPITAHTPEGGGPSPAHTAAAEHLVAPFRAEATPPRTERVIERTRSRGTGVLAALLGLEYIGRKRADRKIRKDFGKKLAADRKDNRAALNRTDYGARSTKQELHEVKDQQQSFEKQLAEAERNRMKTAQPETKMPQPELRPELRPPEIKIPQPEAAATVLAPTAEQIVRQTEALKRPEAVLQKVGAAAEQNIPVEAVYERRHEIKPPEPFAAVGGGGSGGPGQANEPILLANALKQRMADEQRRVAASAGLPTTSHSKAEELYKAAVKSGVWGAVALLIFIAILFLIARG